MTWQRVAVIGASGGIGAALVNALRARGCEVYPLQRSATLAEQFINIEDEASIAAAAQRLSASGPFDLIIVATGLLQGAGVTPEKRWSELSAEALAKSFAVNAAGPVLVAKHFLPLLPRKGRAGFAALSARVGSIGDNALGGWYSYRASKAALNMLIKTLSIELVRQRPEAFCAALHPGTVDTGLSQPFQRGVAAENLFTPDFAAQRLLDVLDGLGPSDSGRCFAWDGCAIAP